MLTTQKKLSPKQRLASRLKELRAVKGWSQQGAATSIGVTRGTYGHYEAGRAFPLLSTLAKMAEAFKCTIDYLMHREPIQS